MNLSDILTQRKANAERISQLETEKLALEAEYKTLSEQFELLKTESSNHSESLAAANADIKTRDQKIADLEKQISDFNEALAEADKKEKSAAVEAVKIVATVGVPPVPVTKVGSEGDKSSLSAEEIKTQFNSITDVTEKQKFYAKHRKTLLEIQ